MKRRSLSQPTKRRPPAKRDVSTPPLVGPVIGQTTIEVVAGQLAGLRGVVVGVTDQRWSIRLDEAAQGVLLSIDPKWVRVIPASGR